MDESLEVTFEDFKKCVTPKTKAVLLSYYFGYKYEPVEIYEYCK